MRIFKRLLPLGIFLLLAYFFWYGLHLNPRRLPSALINQPAPAINLPSLNDPTQIIKRKVFIGHVSLLNVWASWCETCLLEHPVLVDIANQHQVMLIGLDYKDNRQNALNWLQQRGNPYSVIAFDRTGKTAINWGVYGTPETFVIDKQGIIRYKYIGPLTHQVWQQKLLPVIKKLQGKAT
ncbi:MAG: DsbE family thiol:disulfide interchange protein [Pseudomonadota bacterium]